MSRKDYRAAVSVVQNVQDKNVKQAQIVMQAFIEFFAADNCRFDRDRFVKACQK